MGAFTLTKICLDLLGVVRLRENEESFNRYKIRPRVLRNVSKVDTSAEFLGYKARPTKKGQAAFGLIKVPGRFSMRVQSISNAQVGAFGRGIGNVPSCVEYEGSHGSFFLLDNFFGGCKG